MKTQTSNPSTPLELLTRLIGYPSITPLECGIFELIKSILFDFEVLEIQKEGVKNLFLFKKFGDVQKKGWHLCFGGHIDVVPPGDGWESHPFEAILKDGYLYGRGAQDMKSGVSAFVCAIRDFTNTYKNDIAKTSFILSLLLTSDEEGVGIYGTKIVLETLLQKDLLPDMAVVAEPTCVAKMGDRIKIGRRGSVNGIINIAGIQGHVAYPEKCQNPVELLGARLGKLAGVELDSGDEYFSPSKLVITDIRGGLEVVNVTPANLRIMFNVRNSTASNLSDIEAYVRKVLDGLPYELELKESSKPFITRSDSKIAQVLSKAIEKICSNKPEFSTSGGTSDARYFGAFGVEVVEFGVLNDRIHSVNERVDTKDLQALYEVFLQSIFILAKEKINEK